MKSWISYAGAVLSGAVLGLASAYAVLNNTRLHGQFEYEHWSGSRDAGSTAAGPYTRGIVATTGLLALNRSETIYFHRYIDDQGAQLHEDCAYELTGGELPARWWSITVYAPDDFLPMNGDDALSMDASRITKGRDGRWVVRLAPTRSDAPNWVSTRNAGEFNVALRMYNPLETAVSDPAGIPYPAIRRLACEGSAS